MYQNTQFSLITLYLLQLLENCYVSKEKEMFFISYPHVVNLFTFSFTFYNAMIYKSYSLKLLQSKLASASSYQTIDMQIKSYNRTTYCILFVHIHHM